MAQKSIIEKYKEYRKVARDYLSAAVTEVDDFGKNARRIGKMLGLYRQNTLVFEEDNETSAFIDFALSEKLYSGKSKIEQVLENNVKDQKLAEVLTAYNQSFTSLFEVKTPHPDEYKINRVWLL